MSSVVPTLDIVEMYCRTWICIGPAVVHFGEVIDKLDNGNHTVEFYSGKRTKETLTLRICNKF